MSSTKSLLAEQVLRLLGEAGDNSRYDLREVVLAVGQARDYRIRMDYFENQQAGDFGVPQEYLSVFEDVTVKHDLKRKRDYIDLPGRYMKLPKDRGLFSVSNHEETRVFVHSNVGAGNLLKNHPAFRMEGLPVYSPEGSRAYFRRPIMATYPTVLVKLVQSSDAFGDAEELPIPDHLQYQIVQDAFNLLRPKPATDKLPNLDDKPLQ
jgi:hypothetical protein